MTIQKKSFQAKGQALITLLFFMSIAVTVLSASALILASNIASSTTSELGLKAYAAAESGAEDGLLYLLRHPTVNQNLPIYNLEDVQVMVTINGGTVTSTGSINSTIRKVQIQTSNTGGIISTTSWKEIN